MLYQRYGWDYWVYVSQPEQEIEELMAVITAQADAKIILMGKGTAPVGERSKEQLLAEARRAGLPISPYEMN